jgi:hypothetical protein
VCFYHGRPPDLGCRLSRSNAAAGVTSTDVDGQESGADYLRLDDDDAPEMAPLGDEHEDAFTAQFSIPNCPIVADRCVLRNMSVANVLVRRWPSSNTPAQYFWVADPDADLIVGDCQHFFESVEYESLSLGLGHRPISHSVVPDL